MKIEKIDLFSVPLFFFEIKISNYDEIKKFILNTHKNYTNNVCINSSIMGNNTNYSDSLLSKNIVTPLISEIELNVKKIFDEFYCYTEITPFVSDIWSTCVKSKEFFPSNHFHIHSNSLFSGVWYPFNSNSDIIFRNEKKDFFHFEQDQKKILEENKKFMSNNYSITKISPKKNTVILFPSNIHHAISYHENLVPRYSVAFNIFFKGTLKAPTANLSI